MSIKSVLLSSPVRVGPGAAAKKYEAGGDIAITSQAPFIVISRTEGESVHSVGIPAASVVLVEYVVTKAEKKGGK
jgi:hypothetical protein